MISMAFRPLKAHSYPCSHQDTIKPLPILPFTLPSSSFPSLPFTSIHYFLLSISFLTFLLTFSFSTYAAQLSVPFQPFQNPSPKSSPACSIDSSIYSLTISHDLAKAAGWSGPDPTKFKSLFLLQGQELGCKRPRTTARIVGEHTCIPNKLMWAKNKYLE